ncbi:MAG: hypothetical protein IJ109_10660 [Firmicutes bacterium]|nr:hypothetical protein [Bacillota bacterium]MBQ9016557.1 hypothetical protein [Bacillota bacterium]
MRKITTILAAVILLITLAGCGGSKSAADGPVDVDLTTLSSTMVYSEVFNMVNEPEDYIGKTVKMNGAAASYYDEAVKETYYACIIQDATACCAQGIEYVLDGAEYPADGEEITVVGEFRTYETADGTSYCTLEGAELL